jgi:hypothetical protein
MDSSEQRCTSQTYLMMPGPPDSTTGGALRTAELLRRKAARRASPTAVTKVRARNKLRPGAAARPPGSALWMRGLPGEKNKAAAYARVAP